MKPRQKLLKSQINMGNYVGEISTPRGSGEERGKAKVQR